MTQSRADQGLGHGRLIDVFEDCRSAIAVFDGYGGFLFEHTPGSFETGDDYHRTLLDLVQLHEPIRQRFDDRSRFPRLLLV